MRRIVTALLLLASCTSDSPPHPLSHPTLERQSYAVGYDGPRRQPCWVYERLTAETLQGSADRARASFVEDSSLPKPLRSTNADYKGSHFDRGHMSPAGNSRLSEEAMAETFYLSNISPQVPELNRGLWKKLEAHVRTLAQSHSTLHVYTGPLYLSHLEEDGKRYVKYQVIGESEVAVPTHYFKAIFTESRLGLKYLVGYIVPNQNIDSNTSFDKFKASIQQIEKGAGLSFSK